MMSLRCTVLMLGVVFSALAARATVLEVNVPDGTEQTNFTAAQMSSIATLTADDEIRKTGGGALKITSINKIGDFKGTLRLSDGCYVLGKGSYSYDSRSSALGFAGEARVIVEAGATLYSDCYTMTKTNGFWGVKIRLNGSGYNNQGALVLGGRWNGSSEYSGFYPVCDVVLDGPTTIAKGADPGYFHTGSSLDMNGYDLTVINNAGLKGIETVTHPGQIVNGSNTFDISPNGSLLVEVYVAEGVVQTNLTAEQLARVKAACWTDTRGGIWKTGPGALRVCDGFGLTSTVVSEIRLSEGVYIMSYKNGAPFGSDPAKCTVYVEDGATLFTDEYCNGSGYIDGLNIHLAGAGAPGIGGALVLGGNWNAGNKEWYGIYPYGWKVTLDADATVMRGYSNGYFGYKAGQLTTIDLQGHTLRVNNTLRPVNDINEGFDLRGVSEIRNPGKIIFDGANAVKLGPIDWQGAGELVLANGATFVSFPYVGGNRGAGWTLTMTANVTVSSAGTAWMGAYSMAEGKTLTFSTGANQDLWVTNGVSGAGNVAFAANASGRIYFGGENTYAGTTAHTAGGLILLGKNAIPGGYSVDKLPGVTTYTAPIAFAKQSASCPNGWTGAEVWDLVKKFRYTDAGADRKWTIGVYTLPGDDFDIPCDFTESVGGSPCANMGTVTFQTFGGGRAVIRGIYPEGDNSFTPFRLGAGATIGQCTSSNLVYSAPAGTTGQVNSTTMSFGGTDMILENVYWWTGAWRYWYLHGTKANGYDLPERLTVGSGACTDCIRESGGRALYACGDVDGATAVIELKEGGIISNSIWVASCETVSRKNQVGAFIQRGGELQYQLPGKVGNNLAIGGSPNKSLGYAEINAGKFVFNPSDNGPMFAFGNYVESWTTLHQKGGTLYAKDGHWGRGGKANLRFSGGTQHVAGCMYVPRRGGQCSSTNGLCSIVIDSGNRFVVSNAVELAQRIGSAGFVTVSAGSLLEANHVCKYKDSDGFAGLSFRGGGVSARLNGESLFGTSTANTALDRATVFAEGAILDALAGVTASVDVPLEPPTGQGIVAITVPQGARVHAAAPYVIITGDGYGATASAIYDSETMKVTGVEITNPGWGYTEASAEMFFGGAVTNWPLKVTLGDAVTTGGLTKRGPGTIVLNAANTYGGDTVLEEGVLKLGAADALPVASTVVCKGGAIDLNGLSPTGLTFDLANLPFEKGEKYVLARHCGTGLPSFVGLPEDWVPVNAGGTIKVRVPTGVMLIVK